MKKVNKKIMNIISFLLIVAFCIKPFAAVVSDNDGAAFITKAEFDSYKNEFQTRLNSFNSNIDNKISDAISSYLSGVRVAKQRDVKQMANYNTIRWMHGPYMYFTNRKFTGNYGSSTGTYTDKVQWQILNPENRRQADWDPYTWSWDYLRSSYDIICVSFMLQVKENVPKQWGDAYGNTAHGSGPTIYIECEKIDGDWVLTDGSSLIRGEEGYNNYIAPNQHSIQSFTNSWGWANAPNLPSSNPGQKIILSNVSQDGDILGYRMENIPLIGVTATASFTSHITKKDNPHFPESIQCYLWESAKALKTGCGANVNISARIDDGLIEDNRWKTQSQFNKDQENFRYSMFGVSDDVSKVNVGPKLKPTPMGNYIDLSESGEEVSYGVSMQSINLTNVVPWDTKTQHTSWLWAQPANNPTFTLTIPLFYRVKYSDLRNRAHKSLKGEYLKKGDGYPVFQDAEKDGNLQLKFKYEEKTNVDTTVTTLTVDHKIKTYFKNKRFSDTSGTFYQGYKKIDGSGTKVSLNGTEWTGREVTVNIPVKKGDDVWMRIDPLTANGIYCQMTDIQATFVTE